MINNACGIKSMAMLLMFVFFSFTATDAQTLQIGDMVPEIEFNNSWNNNMNKINLRKLNKQLVIIHFWDTRCKGCWDAMTKIDTLQKKYNESIRFVLVSKQPEKEITSFFSTVKKIKPPKDVIILTGDTVLGKLFPYETVPHQVWLEKGKKVIAITANSNTNVKTIESYLNTATINLPVKKKDTRYNWEVPALTHFYNKNKAAFTTFSYLVPAVDSIYPEYAVFYSDKDNTKPTRLIIHKYPIAELLITAFNENRNKYAIKHGNVLLNLKNKDIYLAPEDEAEWSNWNKHNLYLYDVQIPANSTANLFDIMKEDIRRAFSLKTSIIKQEKQCMELRLIDNGTRLVTKGGKTSVYSPKTNADSMLVLNNVPFAAFTSRIQSILRKQNIHFFVDATGYTGNVDISFHASLFNAFDMNLLLDDIGKYGLELKAIKCIQDVLVITDN